MPADRAGSGQPAVISTVLPSGVVDEAHVRPEVVRNGAPPAAGSGRDQIGVRGVHRGVALDEELEHHAPVAGRELEVRHVPAERRREDEVVAATELDHDVATGLRVVRKRDAEPAEHEGPLNRSGSVDSATSRTNRMRGPRSRRPAGSDSGADPLGSSS